MSRRKAYGIVTNKGEILPGLTAEDFSNEKYRGISLWNTGRNTPAVIQQRNDAPYIYRVIFNTSSIYFGEYDEACEFCRQRGFMPIKREK